MLAVNTPHGRSPVLKNKGTDIWYYNQVNVFKTAALQTRPFIQYGTTSYIIGFHNPYDASYEYQMLYDFCATGRRAEE